MPIRKIDASWEELYVDRAIVLTPNMRRSCGFSIALQCLSVGLFLIIGGCGADDKFVEAIPLKLVERKGYFSFEEAPEFATAEFWRNFRRVLEVMDESYKVNANGTISITRELRNNEELLANICNKARDEAYLKQLPPIRKK